MRPEDRAGIPRIFLPDGEIPRGLLTLTGEKARYLSTVLRCRKDQTILLTERSGGTFLGSIVSSAVGKVEVHVLDEYTVESESPLDITLLQGLLKGDRMDLVIQKTTELGVKEIIPVVTERSQVRETRKLTRWGKIAEEASRQSGRSFIPIVREVHSFESVVNDRRLPGERVLFWERDGHALSGVLPLLQQARAIALFIGPEGGFSEAEVLAATMCGFRVATLGKRILRAETAAIALTAIVQYVFGDISG